MNAEGIRYTSFSALRAAHTELLKRHHGGTGDGALLDEVRAFIRQGRMTGRVLDEEEDRWASQSLLDYWATALDRMGHVPPDSTLVDFDPDLAPELPAALCPYVGLDSFGPDQHEQFFGREEFVARVLGRLRDERFLALIGASGSGKSSVALAGVLPALRAGGLPESETWHYVEPLVPGAHPLKCLCDAVRASDADGSWQAMTEEDFRDSGQLLRLVSQLGRPAVVVIDQFEEVFTLCEDQQERGAFIENLLALIEAPDTRHTVVLTMRTDFEPYVARLPRLRSWFDQASELVTPLSAPQLRAAIEEPAAQVGLKFEERLVERLLHDVVGEPAALPLLQFTLLKLWENRERNRVTWDAYTRLGGGREALARSADEFWHTLLHEEQTTGKRILFGLIRWRSGLEVHSRRARREELYRSGEAAYRIDHVLEKLAAARLIRVTPGETPGDDQVEVAHEALLRNWPTLAEWLEEERTQRRYKVQLSASAQQWQEHGRDSSLLLRGPLLVQAQLAEDLDDLEAEFVRRSLAHQRRRERQRQLRYIAGGVGLALLAIAAVMASWQTREARLERQIAAEAERARFIAYLMRDRSRVMAESEHRARDEARRQASRADTAQIRAASEARRATREEARATTGGLIVAATGNLDEDPERSLLLAMRAVSRYRAAGLQVPPAAHDALSRALKGLRSRLRMAGHFHPIWEVAFDSTRGRVATVGGGGRAAVYDARSGKRLFQLPGHTRAVYAVAFSPDGTRLATGSRDRTAIVWDTETGRMLRRLEGHDNSVFALAFSPDGRRLATAGADSRAIVWDLATGDSIHVLGGHDGAVYGLGFSPDGARLATASWDGTSRVWNTESGLSILELEGHENYVLSARFSPDGKRLVTASLDGTARVWDPESGDRLQVIDAGNLLDVAVSPDGRDLATAGSDGTVRLWDAATGEKRRTFSGHDGWVYSVAFAGSGTRLLSGSLDGTARIWDVRSDSAILTVPREVAELTAVAWSGDGTVLATAGKDASARLWDARSGAELTALVGHREAVWDVAFSPSGKRVATASEDGRAIIWDAVTGERILDLEGHASEVWGVAFSPDDQFVVTGSSDETAIIWDTRSGTPRDTLEAGYRIYAVAVDVAGSRIATGGRDGMLTIWDAHSGTPLDTLGGHSDDVYAIAFGPLGKRVATASWDGTAIVWDAETGDSLEVLSGHVGGVLEVAFAPDGYRLATASGDGRARVWDATSGELLLELPGHGVTVYGVVFSPDGSRLATAGLDGTARVWDVTQHPDLPALFGHTQEVYGVAFSPDGRRIATASRDRTAIVWEAATGRSDLELAGHTNSVFDVKFSPDGAWIATGSADRTAVIWNARDGTLRHRLTGHDATVSRLAFSVDGGRLATASWDGQAIIWDAESGESLTRLDVDAGRVRGIAFSPDGQRIVTGGADNLAKVWDAQGGELFSLAGHTSDVRAVAFSPEGRRIVTAGDDALAKVWDASSGLPLLSLQGHSYLISDVAIDSASGRIATSSWDYTARVWDASGRLLFVLAGHSGRLSGTAFSPDGKRLATASHDRTVRLHYVDLEDMIALAWARVTRPLNAEECGQYLRDECPLTPAELVVAGRAQARQGDREGARASFLRAVELEPALTASSKAARLVSMGEHLVESGALDAARAAFEAARRLDRSRSVPDPADLERRATMAAVSDLVSEGRRLVVDGRIAGAIASFRRALELAPDHDFDKEAQLVVRQGRAWARESPRRNRIEEAVDAYELALTLGSTAIDANQWNSLCWFGTLRGYSDSRLLDACERAASAAPDSGYIRDSRGLALALSGESERAIEDFEAFIAWTRDPPDRQQRQKWVDQLRVGDNPFTRELRLALLRFEHGELLRNDGDLEGAVEQYRAAIRLDPSYVFAHVRLGTALLGLKRYDEARANYREANRLAIEDRLSLASFSRYVGTAVNATLEDSPVTFEIRFETAGPQPGGVVLIGDPLIGSGAFTATWQGDSLIILSQAATGDTIRWVGVPNSEELGGPYTVVGGMGAGQEGRWTTRLAAGAAIRREEPGSAR